MKASVTWTKLELLVEVKEKKINSAIFIWIFPFSFVFVMVNTHIFHRFNCWNECMSVSECLCSVVPSTLIDLPTTNIIRRQLKTTFFYIAILLFIVIVVVVVFRRFVVGTSVRDSLLNFISITYASMFQLCLRAHIIYIYRLPI